MSGIDCLLDSNILIGLLNGDAAMLRCWCGAIIAGRRYAIPLRLSRVFTYNGNPLANANTQAWRKALAAAGIENFRWHDLRHTWASWHVMRGTPHEVLRVLGGWKDLRMLMNYAHLAPSYVAGYAGNAVPWSSIQEKKG